MGFSHFPELDSLLSLQNTGADGPPSIKEQYRNSTAEKKRMGAVRAFAFAGQYRRDASPYQENAADLRRQGRDIMGPLHARLMATHCLKPDEQAAFNQAARKLRASRDMTDLARPLLTKAEALEEDAAWLVRSADWQDLRARVKKALHLS